MVCTPASRFSVAVAAIAVAVAGCAKANTDTADAPFDSGIPTYPDATVDATICVNQPCDILPQCGCGSVTSTQSCDVDVSDLMGTACREILSPGHEMNACNSLEGCDVGYVCIGGGGHSACKKYCSIDADCGAPRGQCVIEITNGTTPIPGIPPVCSSNCDPVNTAAGGCPAGWKCNIFTQPFMAMTRNIADCSFAGAGGQGANCKVGAVGDDTLCAPNTLCTTVNGGTNYNCRKICNRTAGGPQCAGLTCLAFNPAFTLAGIEYGVCN